MKKISGSEITLVNFRDLGGLVCSHGQRIKSGKIFRSQVLAPQNEADRSLLLEKNLEAIVDLRTDEEINEKKDWVPPGCEYFRTQAYLKEEYPHLPVSKNARFSTIFLRGDHIDDPVIEKQKSYQTMPFTKCVYDRIFSLMDQGKTFVFHCTSGKDRTGICAMMIELAFGRTFEETLEEYLRSEKLKPIHRRNNLKYFGSSQSLIDNIYYTEGVHEELLRMTQDAMLKNYATVFDFLKNEYCVTPDRLEKWRKIYLE